MTHLLRMLVALPNEQNLVPRTPIGQITTIYNFRSGPPMLSSGFHRHPHKQVQQMLVDTHIHSYTKDLNFFKESLLKILH